MRSLIELLGLGSGFLLSLSVCLSIFIYKIRISKGAMSLFHLWLLYDFHLCARVFFSGGSRIDGLVFAY